MAQRSINASRNIIFGVLLKIYQLLCPFFMRTVMIYYMGIEYVGLNSLFSSILQVLNLAELGVGAAMVYSMYRPIAQNNEALVCAILKLYKKYYNYIGAIILIAGVAISPLIPILINNSSEIPDDVNIYFIYYLNLSATVLSYWLFAYRNSLIVAHQRNDIISKINIVTSTIQYAIQLFAIFFVSNYYVYLAAAIFTQVLTNLVTAFVSKKLYPAISPKGELDSAVSAEINQKVRDVFTAKIGSVVLNSFDSIIISAFLGITVLAKYNNYYYIITSVLSFITVIMTSCTSVVGNAVLDYSKEQTYEMFEKFSFAFLCLAEWCSLCFLSLYQPFMSVWLGNDYMLDFGVVICLAIYNCVWQMNALFNMFKDAAGIWHSDRFRPLVVALLNLALNISTVNFLGLYGIVLSTVVSVAFVGIPWILHNLFHNMLMRPLKPFLRKFTYWFVVLTVIVIVAYFIQLLLPGEGLLSLIIRFAVISLIYLISVIAIYRRKKEWTYLTDVFSKLVSVIKK